MRSILITAALIAGTLAGPATAQTDTKTSDKPTVVLVHGAFAGSSSWNGVVTELAAKGYPVVAAALPLRSVKGDSDYVASLVKSIPGPIILVGHSYGGNIISVSAEGRANVKALVYVAGFAPEPGESAASLGDRFPTGTLGSTLAPPVPLSDGSADIYILQAKYHEQFAADVPKEQALQMAATQRPIVQAALAEPVAAAAWRTVPSWFIWGSADRNIPSALNSFMAKRAKAREAIEIPGASHVVMVSHPKEVAELIERAAKPK
jgi:pimeloyl-ACP methyl ester carboxylesterase